MQRDDGAAEVESPFRLLGQYADDETGLCYTRFRYFDAEAGRWYRLAVAQGNASAMSNLGGMYARGRGVVQDYVQAHMWWNVAASRLTGEERKRSADARDALARLMTPEQIAEAQRLAREKDAALPREP